MTRVRALRPAALALLALAASAPLLQACSNELQAPSDAGVCYHLTDPKGAKPAWRVLAKNVPDMEHCAASLEAMRQAFLRLGGTHSELTGAYNGNFIFVRREGIFTAQSAHSAEFPFLVRTGDGRLAPPGMVRQSQP